MVSFDVGPPDELAEHFARLPAIPGEFRKFFWYDWGPIFYRGRLAGDPKFLGIASDPGPTERIVGRTLVGDAGQRVQGFLDKLGLTRSYVLVNAYPVALRPGNFFQAKPLLSNTDQRTWRNRFYDMVKGSNLQAIVAFGGNASDVLELWDDKPDVPTFEVPHPSHDDEKNTLEKFAAVITSLRAVVTPDDDGNAGGPNYDGTKFEEADYKRIPQGDLPFGLPPWIGDDVWGRRATPRHNNCVKRPTTETGLDSDKDHTLIWRAPTPEELDPN